MVGGGFDITFHGTDSISMVKSLMVKHLYLKCLNYATMVDYNEVLAKL